MNAGGNINDSLTVNLRIEKFEVDHSGNYLIAGQFNNTFSYGGVSLFSRGYEDNYLLKISQTGSLIFLKGIGSASGDYKIAGLTSDLSNKTYLTFDLLNTTYIGSDSIPHDTALIQIVLAVLNSDGSLNTVKVKSINRPPIGYFYAGRVYFGMNNELFMGIGNCYPNECVEYIMQYSNLYDSLSYFYAGVDFEPGAAVDESVQNVYYLTNPASHYHFDPVLHKKRISDNTILWQKGLGGTYSAFFMTPLLLPGNIILTYGFGGSEYTSPNTSVTFDDTTLFFGNENEMLLGLMDTSGTFYSVLHDQVPGTGYIHASYDLAGHAYLLSRWMNDTTYTMGTQISTSSGPDLVISKLKYTEIVAGTEEEYSQTGLNIYPNPSKGKFNLIMNNVSGKITICIYDILGNRILSQNLNGNELKSIDLSCQAKGIYFVQIDTGKEKFNKKVVIN
jgi:hypothetical protein